MVKAERVKEQLERGAKVEEEFKEIVKESFEKNEKKQMEAEKEELLNSMWDLENVKNTLAEFRLDADSFPLTRLSREQIIRAYSLLSEIEKLLVTPDKKEHLLQTLSNDFYTLIPHNLGMKKAALINHGVRIREKIKILESLQGIEAIQTQLVRSMEEFRDNHPLDVYGKLISSRASISLIPQDSGIGQLIITAIRNTVSEEIGSIQVKVKSIFEVKKGSE